MTTTTTATTINGDTNEITLIWRSWIKYLFDRRFHFKRVHSVHSKKKMSYTHTRIHPYVCILFRKRFQVQQFNITWNCFVWHYCMHACVCVIDHFYPPIVVDVVCHWYFIRTRFNNPSWTLVSVWVCVCKGMRVHTCGACICMCMRSRTNAIMFDQHICHLFYCMKEKEMHGTKSTMAINSTLRNRLNHFYE